VTAADIVARIRRELKAPQAELPMEGFCSGDPNAAVDSAVVCFAPSVEVIERCVAEKKRFIISREHPYYLHDWSPEQPQSENWSATLPKAEENDAAVNKKKALLKDNGIIVYRLCSAWDKARPTAQAAALANALGLRAQPSPAAAGAEAVYADVPATTLDRLAHMASARLNSPALRVAGDPNLPVSRIAVMHGLVGTLSLAKALRDPSASAVIVGETCEWEATPYFQDVMATGRRIGMLLVGYESSEDPGCADVAHWIQSVVPGLTAVWWKDSDPLWIPWPGAAAKEGARS
jgi:putative NIF3 family GTP cyclohydrolase 1 type 2